MVSASTPAHDEIARIAYALWEAEGRPEGRDLDHWTRARQMIRDGRAEVAFAPISEPVRGQEGATPSPTPENATPGTKAEADPAPASRKQRRGRPSNVASRTEEAPETASETPGPRNPKPLPATTPEGYVAVPSVADVAGGAMSDDPRPPVSPPRPRRRTT